MDEDVQDTQEKASGQKKQDKDSTTRQRRQRNKEKNQMAIDKMDDGSSQ